MTQRQKLVARYLVGGMTTREAAKHSGVRHETISMWLHHMKFRQYLATVEDQYLSTIDQEIIHLKLVAFNSLRKAIEQDKDLLHKRWAVDKVFQVEAFKEDAKRKTADTNIFFGMGQAFDSPEQKRMSKEFLKTFSDNRYGVSTKEASA